MTSVAWRIVRTVTEPAVITSMAVTMLSSGVAVWSTRRVSTLKRENNALRNELTCQQIGAQWMAKSKGLLKALGKLEDDSGSGETTH